MKARIKFQKYGAMKFIGHLDVMRYFQKLCRRAEIDNEYSKGYSPHQIMSFAAPLGVGLTSDGEYLDIQLLSSEESNIMIERMNGASAEGIRIIGFQPLMDPIENQRVATAMSLVASADYLVSLKDGYFLGEIISQEEFQKQFSTFLSQAEIVINKKTKNSEMDVDIKPMITLSAFDEIDYNQTLISLVAPEDSIQRANKDQGATLLSESVAQHYENGILLYLQVDTGSAANLKPELVIEAFCNSLDIPFEKYAWQVHRLEVYTRDVESNKIIPLNQLER